MGTTAQFRGELSHLHHPHFFPVLLTEEGHGACLPGILQVHDLGGHRQVLCDLFVHNLLHPVQFLPSHGCKMAEVEAQPLPVHIGTGLFHMVAQHFPKGLVQQMGGTVVLAGGAAPVCIHHKGGHVPYPDHAFCDSADMSHLAPQELHCILHLEAAVCRGDETCVCILASHGGIEGGLLHNDRAHLTVRKGFHQFALRGQHTDP